VAFSRSESCGAIQIATRADAFTQKRMGARDLNPDIQIQCACPLE
jgi:hypothetical protein